ncbi:MAG: hypothetical protein A4E45_01902 [Methanosaeta sp. PtaB.Bin039]|nr:MAG: hypothetical protein A4E45_01902 [Methanosaeta sp. PtaB.Bin039]OPY45123.1 MAG: hypothetical protein A4E47_01111 [Methanosaeta sp. PtaU1.Bin028]HOT07038.1 hypothetical protein [Methanotrichaceae archaeon]HQF16034.1 hypothetical protein [Methanotrichaceae archaeon]HQI90850.1 hypothetical protein [Methanotrichaceae archaeon]
MDKKTMEIGICSGLVLIMILAMLGVRFSLPQDATAYGYVAAMVLFMILMSGAGLKLIYEK